MSEVSKSYYLVISLHIFFIFFFVCSFYIVNVIAHTIAVCIRDTAIVPWPVVHFQYYMVHVHRENCCSKFGTSVAKGNGQMLLVR